MSCGRKIGPFDSLGRPKRKNTVPLKNTLVCRGCGAEWFHDGTLTRTQCPSCGKAKDARDRRSYVHPRARERLEKLKEWRKAHQRETSQKNHNLLKKRLFFKIHGGPDAKCSRCGCNDWRLIEVNHKNGGGKREFECGKYATAFYHDIIQGRRPTEDLELLCRPCNAIHYLELKFGPLPMRVLWDAAGK